MWQVPNGESARGDCESSTALKGIDLSKAGNPERLAVAGDQDAFVWGRWVGLVQCRAKRREAAKMFRAIR